MEADAKRLQTKEEELLQRKETLRNRLAQLRKERRDLRAAIEVNAGREELWSPTRSAAHRGCGVAVVWPAWPALALGHSGVSPGPQLRCRQQGWSGEQGLCPGPQQVQVLCRLSSRRHILE